MPEMIQQVPEVPPAFATTSTSPSGTVTDPATTVEPAPVATTPAGGGLMSALMRLWSGFVDAPKASGPEEDKEAPVAIGDGVKGSYDILSSPAPGVSAPDSSMGDELSSFSTWWPSVKAGYEMVTKGPEEADASTLGEGVTGPIKSLISNAADAGSPGAGTMIGSGMDAVQQFADLLVPNQGGVNGFIGDQVKRVGTAGNEVLEGVASGVNTVGGGAVGAVDSVVAAAQHSLGIDDGAPLDLPTELDPIEERMTTEWPPPLVPTPAIPMQTVTLPPEDLNPLGV